MKRRFHSIISLLAIILLMMAGTGCVEPLLPESETVKQGKVELPIKIYLPDGGFPTTKAGAGDARASVEENTIYDLQVWMYTHQDAGSTAYDAEGAVAYLRLTDINKQSGEYFEVNMPLPLYVLEDRNVLLFDFYVLANGHSAGFDLENEALRKLTRATLKHRLLTGTDTSGFGSKMVDKVPERGLPMACFFNNDNRGFDLSFLKLGFSGAQMKAIKDLNGQVYSVSQATDMHLTEEQKTYVTSHCLTSESKWSWASLCPQISMVRTVSKLRFVFAKSVGMTGTEIISIELVDSDGTTGVIPDSTYLFPREKVSVSGIDLPTKSATVNEVAYEKLSWGAAGSPLLKDEAIKSDSNPLRLRSSSNVVDAVSGKAPANMTAQEYDSFLTSWVNDKSSTQKVIYLRESNKIIKGKIKYKVNGQEAEEPAAFSMEATGSFHRNHAWTIFAYFTSDGLNLEITIAPWTGTSNDGQHLKK